MNYLGDFTEDATIYLMFNTFTSNDPSASSTITNFVNTDVHIHKDDGLAQRNNVAGITVSVNFDGITGSHMVKIDTSDNTVAGFWVTGKDYFVRIEGTTVDAGTINAVVGHFSIENRHNEVDLTHVMGTILTEGAGGRLAAALIKLFDVAVPVLTATSVNQSANNNTILAHTDYGNAKLVRATTPANKLDVSGTGEAGLDFANIKNATGAHTLTNITVPVCTTNSDMVAAAPTVGEIQTEIEENGASVIDTIRDYIENVTYGLSALKTLIDNVPTTSEFEARSDLAGTAAGLHGVTDGKIDVIDGIVDRILEVTEIKKATVDDLSASTTKFKTTLTEAATFWTRSAILFTTGNNTGQIRKIKNHSDGATGEITLQTPLDSAPANGDNFTILGIRAFITSDIEDIVDQMCDELLVDHGIAGSFAKKISDQVNPPSQILNDYKATGFSTHNAAAIKTAIEAAGSHLALIKTQTDLVTSARMEVLTDWINDGRLDLLLDAIKAKADNLPSGIAKNVALSTFDIYMLLEDGITEATGKTVTGQIRKDAGSFTGLTNAITEVSSGLYTMADGITQAEMNANKITLKFTASDCRDTIMIIYPT